MKGAVVETTERLTEAERDLLRRLATRWARPEGDGYDSEVELGRLALKALDELEHAPWRASYMDMRNQRDHWRERAEDAEGRIANALA